jgi:hypothetical protein
MYKIKFLQSLMPNKAGDAYDQVYHEQMYGEADIKEAAVNFKILGLIKVASIELVGVTRLSYDQVLELFYPEKTVLRSGEEIQISETDKKFKEDLKKEVKKVEPVAPVLDKKAIRDALKDRAAALGIEYPKTISNDQLEAKIKEAENINS